MVSEGPCSLTMVMTRRSDVCLEQLSTPCLAIAVVYWPAGYTHTHTHLSRAPWGLFNLNPGSLPGPAPCPLCFLPTRYRATATMAGMKTATGDYIDSSWELRVFVGEEDPEAESVTLRVTGESHIGGVLLKIVEEISECRALC